MMIFIFGPPSRALDIQLATGDGGFNPSRCTVECDFQQLVHTHCLCHQAGSIIWLGE